jgi:hypothetical protein
LLNSTPPWHPSVSDFLASLSREASQYVTVAVVRVTAPHLARLTPAEQARLDGWSDRPDEMLMADRAGEDERMADRRLWAVVMLTRDLAVARSILLGRPVLGRQIDAEALRHALRGEELPPPDNYFRVRPGHMDALAEGGPFVPNAGAE